MGTEIETPPSTFFFASCTDGWRQQYPSPSKGRAPYRPVPVAAADLPTLPPPPPPRAEVEAPLLCVALDREDLVDFLDDTLMQSSRPQSLPPLHAGQALTILNPVPRTRFFATWMWVCTMQQPFLSCSPRASAKEAHPSFFPPVVALARFEPRDRVKLTD